MDSEAIYLTIVEPVIRVDYLCSDSRQICY